MRVAAILAGLAVADVVAERAEAQLVLDVEDRLRQVLGVVAAGAQHMEGEPLRGFLADAGEAFEFGDQPGERFGEIGHVLRTARAAGPCRPACRPSSAAICVVHLLDGLVAGGHDHVLEHLDIARDFGVDLHAEQILLAVHLDRDHAAAGGGLHADQRDLLLQLLLHLLRLAASFAACCRVVS